MQLDAVESAESSHHSGIAIVLESPELQEVVGKKGFKLYKDVKIVFEKDTPFVDPGPAKQAAEDGVIAQPNVAGVFTTTIPEGLAIEEAITGAGKKAVPLVATAIETKNDLSLIRSGR